MNESFFQWYDRIGRPTLRNIGIVILLLIGLAIAIQFMFWAVTNREPAPIPMQNILVAFLPYFMQTVDHVTRMVQRNNEIAVGRVSGGVMPNPHGGPGAP